MASRKTALASKYVPELCRECAAVPATNAPQEAFKGFPQLNQVWQAALMQVSGTFDTFIPAPTCPLVFTTGWEEAKHKWDHTNEGMKKRPASVKMHPPAASGAAKPVASHAAKRPVAASGAAMRPAAASP